MVSLFTITLIFGGTIHGVVRRRRCSEISVFQGLAVKMLLAQLHPTTGRRELPLNTQK